MQLAWEDLVAHDARQRTTSLALRELGPAVCAQAKARDLSVSAYVRLAVAALLEAPGQPIEAASADRPVRAAGPVAKVTLRMPPSTAAMMATKARVMGLSNGAYLSALLQEGPPSLNLDLAQAARELAASTDLLAVIAADLNHFSRLVNRGTSVEQFEAAVAALAEEVRSHLRLAARLAAELQPVAAFRRRGTRPDDKPLAP